MEQLSNPHITSRECYMVKLCRSKSRFNMESRGKFNMESRGRFNMENRGRFNMEQLSNPHRRSERFQTKR